RRRPGRDLLQQLAEGRPHHPPLPPERDVPAGRRREVTIRSGAACGLARLAKPQAAPVPRVRTRPASRLQWGWAGGPSPGRAADAPSRAVFLPAPPALSAGAGARRSRTSRRNLAMSMRVPVLAGVVLLAAATAAR